MSQESDTQTLNVVNYFIQSSPMNEAKLALDEVRSILGEAGSDFEITNELQQKLLGDHNETQMAHIDDGKEGFFLTTSYNSLGENKFLEPDSRIVYKVDHVTKTVKSSSPYEGEVNETLEASRKKASDALKAYCQTHFKKGKCVTAAFIKPGTSILALCVSAINTKFTAFWTGNWRGQYEVDLSISGPQPLMGGLKANVHYYESGNVQFNAEKEAQGEVDASSIQGVVDKISQFESDWQSSIDKMLVDMHEQTFKQMRRILPLSKTKMNWSNAAHSLTDQLAERGE